MIKDYSGKYKVFVIILSMSVSHVSDRCVSRVIFGFGLYQSCWDRGGVGRVSVFWLRWCRWGVDRGLGPLWCYVCVRCESGFSVYCAWRIPVHLRCTQCSILLHLFAADITNPDSFV